MHEDRVVEVYWISHEDREAREADHVRTCDETIAPGNLHAADKKDLCRGLTATVDKAKSRPMSSWLTLLMASMAYSLTSCLASRRWLGSVKSHPVARSRAQALGKFNVGPMCGGDDPVVSE